MDPKGLAAQLGLAIKETPEYHAMQEARGKVDQHEAARIMLEDFQHRQEDFRRKALEGKAGEEETSELRKLAGIVGCNPYIREYMTAENRLTEMVLGLQQQMMTAAGLMEQPAEADGGREENPEKLEEDNEKED